MRLSFSKIFLISSVLIITNLFNSVPYVQAEELGGVPFSMTLNPNTRYTVSGTIYVNHDSTLTVPAGTKIIFAPNARLVVYGVLEVNGTASNGVIFAGAELSTAPQSFLGPVQAVAAEEPPAEQAPEVAPIEIENTVATPVVSEIEVETLPVINENSVVESKLQSGNKAGGIVFMNGSRPSKLAYLEMVDFSTAILADTASDITADHVTFRDCNTGIMNSLGSVKLTNSSFIDTAFPGQVTTYGTFEHSNTTFSGTGFKGWNYGGDIMEEVHLNSKDGEYYAFGLNVLNGASLHFGPGTTVYIQDGFGLKVYEHGNLFVNGTEASPVKFYGNGTCPLKLPSISGVSESSITVKHANFHDLCGGIAGINTTIKVDESVFKDISGTAIKLVQQGAITVTDTEITKSALAIDLDAALIKNISQNNFHGNAVGVSVKGIYPKAIIKSNAWGSNSGPKISSNPEGTGDSIVVSDTPEVVYRPWLNMVDEEPETPPEEEPEVSEPNTTHNPIIIVPGITGSVLSKNYEDNSELWPNITKLTLNLADSHLDDLALLQTGKESTVRPIAVGDIIRKVSSVDIFDSLIKSLNKEGYVEGTNLFVLPYDWRFSNATNQSLLKNTIGQALERTGKSKVNIIAHSMGGLLVKSYLSENPSAPVDTVFNVAVPHIGAPKTFKTLMYGDDMGFVFSLTSSIKVPVLNEARVKKITQNMPSVYELLPSKKYIDLFGPYIADRTQSSTMNIEGTRKLMIADGRNEKMFPFAQTLHDSIDGMTSPNIRSYNFVGCGSTKSIVGYALTKEQSLTLTGFKLIPEHRLIYGAGDGVVPIGSASFGNAVNYYANAGSHGTLAAVPDIQQAIAAILSGRPVATTPTFSDNMDKCSLPGSVVEVHSPVSLDIYDEQGRHTGFTAEGEVEYGIPGVQYDVINDEKSAFLPSGPEYKIVTRAQAVGTYDMFVSKSDEADEITYQSYYHAVPMLTETSIGTFTIGPDTVAPEISVDDNEDTVPDRIVTPSAALDDPHANDTIPPVSTATFNGTVATIVATDDSSGVLNTKYSTDNIVWNTYSTPFQANPDATLYVVSIDRAGNTEDIKQIRKDMPIQHTSGGGGIPAVSVNVSSNNEENKNIDAEKEKGTMPAKNEHAPKSAVDSKTSSSFLTAPAPDEGTVMSDNEITRSGLIASAGAVAAAGPTTIIIIGALAIAGIGIWVIFSKKPW